MTVLKGCPIPADADGHTQGRRLLAALYEETVGQIMPEIAVADRGKPYFTEGKYYFSISHTKRHVFCALADHPIGIDAEERDRAIDLGLAEKILSPSEKVRFESAPDRRTALLKLWVLKEAAAKLAGTGLRGYPNRTDLSPEDPRVTENNGCFVAVMEEENAV